MLKDSVSDNSEISVSGKDMFGAGFSERTQLLTIHPQELSLSLFRPVSERTSLRVVFHEDCYRGLWVDGIVKDVRIRLDGMQTVTLQVTERSCAEIKPASSSETQVLTL